jgi:intracellular sulfur oxidation DsrE/DsrF family protein
MGVAWGGDVAKSTAAPSAEKMQAMKAEMMKCAVCKNIAAHMDEIGPMKAEVVKLNDGVAMMHSVSDPSKLPVYRAASAATHKAGEASMSMTDEQAKTELCSFCQDIRSSMKAGAKMSVGDTKMGDMMVLTSADPAVQTKLSALAEKCALMAESM